MLSPDFFRKNISVFVVPALIALAACFQLIVNGYPQGHDWVFELVRVVEYREALSSGQGLPLWGADLYRGFGSPVFVFYAPLYVACVSLLLAAGLSLTVAATTVFVFFAVLAAVGVAGLTREIIGRDKPGVNTAAQVASAVFVLAPYFLANMLIRNASAEFVALSLSPYVLWGLVLIYRGNHRGLPLLIISFSLLILAHNLTGLTMAAVLSVIVLFRFRKKLAESFQATVAILFALGLSCWFWLAALGLKDRVRIDGMTQGKFDFHNNFSSVGEMFSYDGLFAVGGLIPVLLFISAIVVVRDKKFSVLTGLLVAGALFVFLQTHMSVLVWENVPLLPLFQFPWRMLGPLSLVAALISGLLFHQYLSHRRFSQWIVFALLAANVVPLMQRYEPLSAEYRQLVDASLNPKGILQQGYPATVLDEYLPRTANKAVSERAPAGSVVLPGSVRAEARVVNNSNIYFKVETDRPGVLNVARWYFPGWRVVVDGVERAVRASPYGAVQIAIPAGRHRVQLWLGQPMLRQWGIWISGVSFVAFVLLLFARRRGWWNVFVEG